MACAAQCDSGATPPDAGSLVTKLTAVCLARLQAHKNAGNPNYVDAIAGVNRAAQTGDIPVDDEFGPWQQQFQ